jgi:hypothetical protein
LPFSGWEAMADEQLLGSLRPCLDAVESNAHGIAGAGRRTSQAKRQLGSNWRSVGYFSTGGVGALFLAVGSETPTLPRLLSSVWS